MDMIRLAHAGNSTIVCHERAIRDVIRRANELKLEIPKPISYREFVANNGDRSYIIDDVHLLLTYIAGSTPVVAATIRVGDGVGLELGISSYAQSAYDREVTEALGKHKW